MKQTSVEILRITISSYKNTEINGDVMVNELLHLIDKHILEMEKQQIIDTYNKGCSEIHLYYEFIKDKNITQTKEPFSAEQYYSETFNK